MWRWGTPQNYCLVFIYELEKQLFNKKLLNWADKKCKYLIFTKIKKIIKKIKGKQLEISLPYTCVPTIFMIWSTVVEISMWRTEIGNHGSFFALLPSPPKKPQNIRILKKWTKLLEILSFYMSVPKTTIIWSTVSEIWSETDKMFCHFGPFFSPLQPGKSKFLKNEKASGDVIILQMCTKNQNHMVFASCNMEYNRQFFVISGHFLCFYPTIDPKK